MPEAASVKYKFFEVVRKGRGSKMIPRTITLTRKNGVEMMNMFWLAENYAVDTAHAKKVMTLDEQREAFGATIKDMEKEETKVVEETTKAIEEEKLEQKVECVAPAVVEPIPVETKTE